MSRGYRIRVTQNVTRTVHVADGVALALELLDILPRERMAELAAIELVARGFERDGGVLRRRDPDGIELEVDLATLTVTARIADDAHLDLTATAERVVDRDRTEAGRAQLAAELDADLEEDLKKRAARLQAEVTARLEGKLRDLRAEVDRVVNRTTAAALKERAAQLGQIEEVSDNPESGELTIRVRV
jgi:ABC-type phosphate transport system auxiliary subunit